MDRAAACCRSSARRCHRCSSSACTAQNCSPTPARTRRVRSTSRSMACPDRRRYRACSCRRRQVLRTTPDRRTTPRRLRTGPPCTRTSAATASCRRSRTHCTRPRNWSARRVMHLAWHRAAARPFPRLVLCSDGTRIRAARRRRGRRCATPYERRAIRRSEQTCSTLRRAVAVFLARRERDTRRDLGDGPRDRVERELRDRAGLHGGKHRDLTTGVGGIDARVEAQAPATRGHHLARTIAPLESHLS